MGKNAKKGDTKKKDKKVTAASVVVEIFSRKKIPSNEDIIAEVKKRVPDSNFDGKQLAWYKTRARQGKIKGLGKISLPKTERATKPSKTKPAKTVKKRIQKKKKRNVGAEAGN